MKKLGVNTAGGVMDIIGAIIYLTAIFVIVGSAVGEAVTMGTTSTAETLSTLFLIYAGVAVVVHIVGVVQSRKVGIKLVGNILGIIGHAIYLLFGAAFGWIAMIIVIISAVFTLKDNKYQA